MAARGQEMPFAQAIRFGETMRRAAAGPGAGATDDTREGRAAAMGERRVPRWQGR